MMQEIYTAEEWRKVRKLANEWYKEIGWYVSDKVLITLLLIFLAGVIFFNNFSTIFYVFITFILMKLYARHEQIEGYVDGWQEGQGYITGDTTIDDLLKTVKPKKTNKN